jgi:hypothetical protein
VVSQSVLRARTLRIHTNPSGTRRPPLIARDGSRGDSPETRARPALRIDSTPHLGMRKKNPPSPTVFTRRDNSSLSFICRSPAFVDSLGARICGSHVWLAWVARAGRSRGSLGVPPASTSSHCMLDVCGWRPRHASGVFVAGRAATRSSRCRATARRGRARAAPRRVRSATSAGSSPIPPAPVSAAGAASGATLGRAVVACTTRRAMATSRRHAPRRLASFGFPGGVSAARFIFVPATPEPPACRRHPARGAINGALARSHRRAPTTGVDRPHARTRRIREHGARTAAA